MVPRVEVAPRAQLVQPVKEDLQERQVKMVPRVEVVPLVLKVPQDLQENVV
jgi:hypothetical protein